MIKKRVLGVVLIGLYVIIFSACGINTQKGEKNNEAASGNVISEELHQEHCDLLAKANEALANINQKVRGLNDIIHEKEVKFTDAQNKALDDFEEKQASINKRMHEIKNIKQEDWELFKTNFEKDLKEINTIIDNLIEEL